MLTPAKQEKVDALVRETVGKGRAIEGLLQSRIGHEKYVNYQIYLLDNDGTVYVNLDNMTAHLSKEPNKKLIKAFRDKEERKLKEQREGKAPAKPKVVKKPKAKKAAPTGQAGWSDEEWARIQVIMAEKKCSRGNAIRQMRNEQAIKSADAQVTPKAEPKKVHDPLAQATPVTA